MNKSRILVKEKNGFGQSFPERASFGLSGYSQGLILHCFLGAIQFSDTQLTRV
jgi:hypothetical protein